MSRSFTDDMKMDSGYFDSGKRIVMLAHTAGIKSSKQLAHLLGVSRNTVQNWHKGGVVAGQEHVEDFCGLINISMAYFYSREFPVNNKEIEKSVNIKKFELLSAEQQKECLDYIEFKMLKEKYGSMDTGFAFLKEMFAGLIKHTKPAESSS